MQVGASGGLGALASKAAACRRLRVQAPAAGRRPSSASSSTWLHAQAFPLACHTGCLTAPDQPPSLCLLLPSPPAALLPGIRQALLAQRDAVTNWPAFKDANKIVGWEEAVPNVCSWSGVNCTDSGMVYRM